MTPAERDFLERFDDCTLPEDQFDHTGHVRMAWLRLKEASFDEALQRIGAGIRRYAESKGATTKYHETVTGAFVRIIASRLRDGESFEQFAARNQALFSPVPLLRRHYSAALLDSDRARREFVEPDLAPLPGSD